MSTYLAQTIYHRQLQADEVQTAIDAGHGLLVVDKNGDPRFVEQPRTFPINEFVGAARKGRVFLAWASRWSAAEELPELCTTEPAAPDVTVSSSNREPEAELQLEPTPQFP